MGGSTGSATRSTRWQSDPLGDWVGYFTKCDSSRLGQNTYQQYTNERLCRDMKGYAKSGGAPKKNLSSNTVEKEQVKLLHDARKYRRVLAETQPLYIFGVKDRAGKRGIIN